VPIAARRIATSSRIDVATAGPRTGHYWPVDGPLLARGRATPATTRAERALPHAPETGVAVACLYARAVKFNPDDLVEYVSHTAARGVFRVRFRDGTETQVRAKTASEAKSLAAKTKGNRRLSPASGGGLTQPKPDKPE